MHDKDDVPSRTKSDIDAGAPEGEAHALRRARADLREVNERLTGVLESITDGFCVLDRAWRVTYLNRRAKEIIRGVKSHEEIVGKSLWDAFPDIVGSEIEKNYRHAMDTLETVQFESYYPPLNAWLELRAFPSPDTLTIYFRDISRRKEVEALLGAERKVLELIATGASLHDVLDTIAREAPARSVDGMLCSVLLLDPSGKRLLHGAAPGLPAAYNEAIHGLEIGPAVGSCGTAAFERRPVFVTDIAASPLWRDFAPWLPRTTCARAVPPRSCPPPAKSSARSQCITATPTIRVRTTGT